MTLMHSAFILILKHTFITWFLKSILGAYCIDNSYTIFKGNDTNIFGKVMVYILKDINLLFKRESNTVYNRYFKEFISYPNVSITKVENFECKMQSFTDSKLFYYVDMITCKFTHLVGHNGKYYKHQPL